MPGIHQILINMFIGTVMVVLLSIVGIITRLRREAKLPLCVPLTYLPSDPTLCSYLMQLRKFFQPSPRQVSPKFVEFINQVELQMKALSTKNQVPKHWVWDAMSLLSSPICKTQQEQAEVKGLLRVTESLLFDFGKIIL